MVLGVTVGKTYEVRVDAHDFMHEEVQLCIVELHPVERSNSDEAQQPAKQTNGFRESKNGGALLVLAGARIGAMRYSRLNSALVS